MKKTFITGLALLTAASAFALTPRRATGGEIPRGGALTFDAKTAETAARNMRNAKAQADGEWEVIGAGSLTDFFVADLLWASPKSFSVTIEQSLTDPNTYRIEHPYANWSDPALGRYARYDEDKDTPLVFHIYNGQYAWFEEFESGIYIDLSVAYGIPEEGYLSVHMWGEDLIKEHGIQTVAAEGTSTLCTITDGILSLGYLGRFGNETSQNVLCDIDHKYAEKANYWVANYDGEFRLVMPSSSSDAEWQNIGTGTMSEFVFSSLFGTQPKTVEVVVDQSVIDPTKYRIKAPYASWYDSQLSSVCYYDEEMATPMIIHVEYGEYAWFETFDTGIYLDFRQDNQLVRGEVTVTQNAQFLVEQMGLENVATYYPDALCKYTQGTLTLGAQFEMDGTQYSTVLTKVGNMDGYYQGNRFGNFNIQFNGNGANDDADWTSIGMAEYTDDIATLLFDDNNDNSQTWLVEMQQYKADPTMFRLVNPYKGWQNPFSDVAYDDTQDHHIVVYTLPNSGLACIGDFSTGLYLQGLGEFKVTTDAYYFSAIYGLDFASQVMPEIFARYSDGVITYPAKISLEGDLFPSMMAYFGEYSDDGPFWSVNNSGKFRIKFPTGDNGVGTISDSDDAKPEYFTLDGVKVDHPRKGELLIMRRGAKSMKVIF